ncbi:exodeoxyribonuclease V subunit gamma [Psychrosphaera ytuae]|uniref:RecBCD enzyme subunit RecC n=1 Tax=Psychrosphaera ytuae TaxID=2820710 RepID=A0A975DCG5_9GAMM|nr:exodeoxyribonuclease V subunit gamma [Psychrosphaera ytuae]QTH64328.1 exodeoxyribonuclease V subunit gamma [Psychrosphaera ytuae]
MESNTLNVIQSNRLDVLATVLTENLRIPNTDDPFKAETVLVHSPGMSEWLKVTLSEKLGIAANLEFPLPSTFIWNLYKLFIPDVPETSVYNKDRLRWHIHKEIKQHLDADEFKSIQQYLATTSDTNKADESSIKSMFSELRAFKLSEKIADAYDNYLMYRPEWLEHWEQGFNDLPGDDEIGHQQWQAILWRALKTKMSAAGLNIHNRQSLHQALLEKLQSEEWTFEQKQGLPSRLFVFGISTLPKHQTDVLEALSSHIDVQILWFNPCQVYWGDILSEKTKARIQQFRIQQMENGSDAYFVSGNPLLASWGKLGRDYLDALSGRDINFTDLFIEGRTTSLLEQVQNDIFKLEFRQSLEPLSVEALNSDHGKRPLPNDQSILIHSCHNPIRELEVLKDSMLSWFEQDESLEPKDILVMVPDINDYAPYIDAVFERDDKYPELTIPYAISDRSGLQENPILNTYVALIGLPITRFKVSEILDWLEVPSILAAFDLDLSELEIIKKWVQESNVKWGVSGQHKSQWALPEDDLHTWLYGLERMMLGYSAANHSLWNGIVSYDDVEGLSANTLAKFIAYISYLIELKDTFSDCADLDAWHANLQDVVERLFTSSQSDTLLSPYVSQQLRDANALLLSYTESGDVAEPVNAVVVQQVIGQALTSNGVSQRFMAGRVNFCTLMPMRSVPFDTIAILGLNDGEFPRHVEPLSFDLVNQNPPRKGDRSRKLDERYLFLEAFCTAQTRLHLSYIGQSDKNNDPKTPSLLVSELIDYINESYIVDNPSVENSQGSAGDLLVIKHPLQPFNSQYFVDNVKLNLKKSYSKQWFSLLSKSKGDEFKLPSQAQSDKSSELPLMMNDTAEKGVELDDLIRFAKNPLKYFYRQQLGVNLDLSEDQVNDLEPFSHDGLTRYQFTELLVNESDAESRSSLKLRHLQAGDFPSGLWGDSLFSDYQTTADKLLDIEEKWLELAHDQIAQRRLNLSGVSQRQISMSFEIESQTLVLQGRYQLIDNLCIVRRISDKVRYDDEVQAWLLHLIRCADGQPGITTISSLKHTEWIAFAGIDSVQAKALLVPWLSAFYQSHFKGECHNWFGSLGQLYLSQFKIAFSELSEEQIYQHLDSQPEEIIVAAERAVFSKLEEDLNPRHGMHLDAYLEQLAANLSVASARENNGPDNSMVQQNTEKSLPPAFSSLSKSLLIGLEQYKQKVKTKEMKEFVDSHFYDESLFLPSNKNTEQGGA